MSDSSESKVNGDVKKVNGSIHLPTEPLPASLVPPETPDAQSNPKGRKRKPEGASIEPVQAKFDPTTHPSGKFDPTSTPDGESRTWSNWMALESHMQKWYHNFDMEAFRVTLSAIVSHRFLQEPPVWMFVIGPASTGKTVLIDAVNGLPNTHMLGDLTPQTFLSGFNKGKGGYSLLEQVGPSGIFLFKDFTTILSKPVYDRAMIISQLREIFDGAFNKSAGSAPKAMHWEGKITVLAACTPQLEKAWTVLRDMGERFLIVRWPRGDGIAAGRKAATHLDHGKEIKEGLTKLTAKFLDIEHLHAAKAPDLLCGVCAPIIHMGEMIAQVRPHVSWENGKISEQPSIEGSTRLIKGLMQLTRAHATMFRRSEVGEEDMQIARRVVLDSMSPLRKMLVMVLPDDGARVSLADMDDLVKAAYSVEAIPRLAIDRGMQELEALGVCKRSEFERGDERVYEMTEQFQKLKKAALG